MLLPAWTVYCSSVWPLRLLIVLKPSCCAAASIALPISPVLVPLDHADRRVQGPLRRLHQELVVRALRDGDRGVRDVAVEVHPVVYLHQVAVAYPGQVVLLGGVVRGDAVDPYPCGKGWLASPPPYLLLDARRDLEAGLRHRHVLEDPFAHLPRKLARSHILLRDVHLSGPPP